MQVGLDEDLGQLVEALIVGLTQVFALILGVGGEEEERHVEVVKEIDDSGSAALASSFDGPADFANASGGGDDGSGVGVVGQEVDEGGSFCIVEQPPRGAEEFRCFDDRDGE